MKVRPLAHSHIFPDFLLKDAADWIEKGKSRQKQPYLTLVDNDTVNKIYCQRKGKVLTMEGLQEYLLCEDCEKLMKIGEDYARLCLYGTDSEKHHTRPDKSFRQYRTRRGKILREGKDERWVDYEKFKRFQISLIWRACAAKGPAFKLVHASDSTKERMRLAMLHGRFDEDLAPCTMVMLDDQTGASLGIVGLPVVEDKRVQFILGGYQWNFYVDRSPETRFILQKSGHLIVLVSDIDCFYTPDEMLNAP